MAYSSRAPRTSRTVSTAQSLHHAPLPRHHDHMIQPSIQESDFALLCSTTTGKRVAKEMAAIYPGGVYCVLPLRSENMVPDGGLPGLVAQRRPTGPHTWSPLRCFALTEGDDETISHPKILRMAIRSGRVKVAHVDQIDWKSLGPSDVFAVSPNFEHYGGHSGITLPLRFALLGPESPLFSGQQGGPDED